MRHYQRKKNNPYLLPHNVYMQAYYLIRDYDRLNEVKKYLTKQGVSVSDKKFIVVNGSINAIKKGLSAIPEFYRKPVMDSIKQGSGNTIYPRERTFGSYKQRFIFDVAKEAFIYLETDQEGEV